MTDERRYDDDEIREILELAASDPDPRTSALASPKGLTLSELQDIGREVGLAPERIAQAASALDARPVSLPDRRLLGVPISVGRTVDLPRAPSDREWEMLVSELRHTFRARGNVESSGSVRQWTNGNLHAYVEPTESGHRLRLGTLKGNAVPVGAMGAMGIVMGLIMFVALTLAGRMPDAAIVPLVLGGLGTAAIVGNLAALPAWRRERQQQMDYIAARALALLEAGSETE